MPYLFYLFKNQKYSIGNSKTNEIGFVLTTSNPNGWDIFEGLKSIFFITVLIPSFEAPIK